MNLEALATSFEHIPDMSPANHLKFDALFICGLNDWQAGHCSARHRRCLWGDVRRERQRNDKLKSA